MIAIVAVLIAVLIAVTLAGNGMAMTESAKVLLLGAGLVGLGFWNRRQRKHDEKRAAASPEGQAAAPPESSDELSRVPPA